MEPRILRGATADEALEDMVRAGASLNDHTASSWPHTIGLVLSIEKTLLSTDQSGKAQMPSKP